MCKLKSAIILKDKIFISDHDSHSKMLEELGITDDYINASKVFVRAELVPENEDAFSNIDNWQFGVDQDITPEWFDKKDCAERMRKAVKEWAKTHIFVGQNNLEISHGENIYIKNCKNVIIHGNATVENICGNTTVEYICNNAVVKNIHNNTTVENIFGNATVENIFGNTTVKSIFGNATVRNIYNDATVEHVYDNATIKYIYGSATVSYIYNNVSVEYICGNATVKYIYGNVTVKGICDTATVGHVYDNTTVERVYDNATVENIFGNAMVKNIFGNATVKSIYDNAMVKCIYDNATAMNSLYSKWNNSTSLTIADNATFKDCCSKTIYHAGGWKFVEVKYEH